MNHFYEVTDSDCDCVSGVSGVSQVRPHGLEAHFQQAQWQLEQDPVIYN